MRNVMLTVACALLLPGCGYWWSHPLAPPPHALTAEEAAAQARSECQAFAGTSLTFDVEACTAERAPKLLDRARDAQERADERAAQRDAARRAAFGRAMQQFGEPSPSTAVHCTTTSYGNMAQTDCR